MLTTTQAAALKAVIQADATLSAFPMTTDGFIDLATALDALTAGPVFYVYRTNIPVAELNDGITWANFTPADQPPVAAVPSSPTEAEKYALSLYLARALVCQGKQFNVQLMLAAQQVINAAKSNFRSGLQDSTTGIPAGSGGNAISAGWVNLRDTVLARVATRAEKALAVGGNGAAPATAATMTIEGKLAWQDVQQARLS